MTTPTDRRAEGEIVAEMIDDLRRGFVCRDPCKIRTADSCQCAEIADKIASLSRQLAEAQEARDLHAAALECYSKEQAIIRKELAEARAEIERYEAAAEKYDHVMRDIGTCGDGGCLVLRPIGQHTNGGCRCWRNEMKAQRVMRAAVLLRAALSPRDADARPKPETGE